MTDQTTHQQALPELPDTPYDLHYEWPDDEDGFGGSEVIGDNGYTADQMRAYAADAVRAALANRPEIPDGWKLVPIEPTKDMMAAARVNRAYPLSTDHQLWHAMLAAAPSPGAEGTIKDRLHVGDPDA